MKPMTPTRRGFLLGAAASALAAASVPGLVAAQNPRPPAAAPARAAGMPLPLEVTQLTEHVHLVAGAGGNIAVHRTEVATLVIDAGIPDRAGDVAAAVAGLARGGGRILVNTHWHFDHVGGNQTLAAEGRYTIIAHRNCHRRLTQQITIEDLGMTFAPLPPTALPTVTFDESLELRIPDPVVLSRIIGAAHTDNDIIVEFPAHNLLHTGDLFFNGWFPVIDRSTGGSLDGMIAATRLLLGRVTDGMRIIPGHGPMATRADLQAQLDLLELTHARLAPLGEARTPMDEVLRLAPLADLDDRWGRGFVRSPVFTRMAYGQWLTR